MYSSPWYEIRQNHHHNALLFDDCFIQLCKFASTLIFAQLRIWLFPDWKRAHYLLSHFLIWTVPPYGLPNKLRTIFRIVSIKISLSCGLQTREGLFCKFATKLSHYCPSGQIKDGWFPSSLSKDCVPSLDKIQVIVLHIFFGSLSASNYLAAVKIHAAVLATLVQSLLSILCNFCAPILWLGPSVRKFWSDMQCDCHNSGVQSPTHPCSCNTTLRGFCEGISFDGEFRPSDTGQFSFQN